MSNILASNTYFCLIKLNEALNLVKIQESLCSYSEENIFNSSVWCQLHVWKVWWFKCRRSYSKNTPTLTFTLEMYRREVETTHRNTALETQWPSFNQTSVEAVTDSGGKKNQSTWDSGNMRMWTRTKVWMCGSTVTTWRYMEDTDLKKHEKRKEENFALWQHSCSQQHWCRQPTFSWCLDI